MRYHNPIIPGFYPDPSVCRVGGDYYLVNSSFEYFPGIPLWHSRDLVHWRQLGHVLTRPSQLDLAGCRDSDGIYAPTIRHHAGIFYVITTVVNGGKYRNFYVTATDPAGPWSDPVWYDQSGIDPSLFFDDDGRVYFQSNRGMQFNMERAIYQSEIDVHTGRRLTEPKLLWRGSGGSYVEGPHLYKKDGWYYLLTAEGGTSYGHMVAIARSRNVGGPYEGCPRNPILSNRHAYETLHGAGHADLVEAHDGTWWMVHLAFRKTVDDIHTLGRETCVLPVEWSDGWPVVNRTGIATEYVDAAIPGAHAWPLPPRRDDFDEPTLRSTWINLRGGLASRASLTARPGWLRLSGGAETLSNLATPSAVFHRQQHFEFSASTCLDFEPRHDSEEAGLAVYMTHQHYYTAHVARRGSARIAILRYTLERIRHVAAEVPLPPGPVELHLSATRNEYVFSAGPRGATARELGIVNTRYLGTEVTGGYNGVVLGLYATGGGREATVPADFDWFEYSPSA